MMARESWAGTGDIPPLGEPLAPPGIVFGNGMELRKVKGDGPHWRLQDNSPFERLKIAKAILVIWFKVIAFRPFVPSVDKQ